MVFKNWVYQQLDSDDLLDNHVTSLPKAVMLFSSCESICAASPIPVEENDDNSDRLLNLVFPFIPLRSMFAYKFLSKAMPCQLGKEKK